MHTQIDFNEIRKSLERLAAEETPPNVVIITDDKTQAEIDFIKTTAEELGLSVRAESHAEAIALIRSELQTAAYHNLHDFNKILPKDYKKF